VTKFFKQINKRMHQTGALSIAYRKFSACRLKLNHRSICASNRIFEALMHKARGARRITVTVTEDVMRSLEQWAAQNLSSLSAETVRAVRERAAQEVRERASA
jgi:hypothetical protein